MDRFLKTRVVYITDNMTVEFFINKNKALDNLDEYGYNPNESLLIKVRWNEQLDHAGGRPMDIDYRKVKTGTVGYITGYKIKPYPYTGKEAKKDCFDVISEHHYPKNRKPIFHKGTEVESIGVLSSVDRKTLRPATPMTAKITGQSDILGHVKGIIISGKFKGRSVHVSTLSSRIIGCPRGETLMKGRCVKK